VTLFLTKGVHPKIIPEMLGHSSIAITLDTYSDVIQGPGEAVDRRAGLDKLISLLVVARRFCIHSANASKRGQ
jgi:hypothetical protein